MMRKKLLIAAVAAAVFSAGAAEAYDGRHYGYRGDAHNDHGGGLGGEFHNRGHVYGHGYYGPSYYGAYGSGYYGSGYYGGFYYGQGYNVYGGYPSYYGGYYDYHGRPPRRLRHGRHRR